MDAHVTTGSGGGTTATPPPTSYRRREPISVGGESMVVSPREGWAGCIVLVPTDDPRVMTFALYVDASVRSVQWTSVAGAVIIDLASGFPLCNKAMVEVAAFGQPAGPGGTVLMRP
jgi:hypothetical protein